MEYKSKKILLFTAVLQVGGAEKQITYLAQGLARKGHQVTVATFYRGGRFWDVLEKDTSIRLISFDKKHKLDVLGLFFRLYKHLRSGQYDIIQSFLPSANTIGMLAAKLAGVKTICIGIRSTFLTFSGLSKIHANIEDYIEKVLANLIADRIIYVSHASREYHEKKGYKIEKSTVIWNGIALNSPPDEKALGNLKNELKVREDEKIIVAIGRIESTKDYPTLIHAFSKIYEACKVRLFIVGGGNRQLFNHLVTLTQELNINHAVSFLGERSDVLEILALSDMYVSSSISEGCSNTVIEAMSMGKKIVATDAGDNAIFLSENRGIVVKPGDPVVLAKAIEKQINQQGNKNLFALDFIKNKISLKQMIEHYEHAWFYA